MRLWPKSERARTYRAPAQGLHRQSPQELPVVFSSCSEGDRQTLASQYNGQFGPCVSVSFFASFSFSVLSLTQWLGPPPPLSLQLCVHLSLLSCPCPQTVWSVYVLASLILMWPHTEDSLCITRSRETTCSISTRHYL